MRNSRPFSSQRTKLFAFANLQNSRRIAGIAVRGFSSENTREKSSLGVSKKRTLWSCTFSRIQEDRSSVLRFIGSSVSGDRTGSGAVAPLIRATGDPGIVFPALSVVRPSFCRDTAEAVDQGPGAAVTAPHRSGAFVRWRSSCLQERSACVPAPPDRHKPFVLLR